MTGAADVAEAPAEAALGMMVTACTGRGTMPCKTPSGSIPRPRATASATTAAAAAAAALVRSSFVSSSPPGRPSVAAELELEPPPSVTARPAAATTSAATLFILAAASSGPVCAAFASPTEVGAATPEMAGGAAEPSEAVGGLRMVDAPRRLVSSRSSRF